MAMLLSDHVLSDTHPEAKKVHLEVYRRMSGTERLDLMFQLSEDMRDLYMAGLRHRHPGATEAQIIHMERCHRLGKELADKVWPQNA